MRVFSILYLVFSILLLFFGSRAVLAHEAYVLTPEQFQAGLTTNTVDPLGTLAVFFGPSYLYVTLIVGLVFGILYLGNFILSISNFGEKVHEWLKKYSNFGLLVVRVTLAASFLYGASSGNVFGPELRLAQIPFGQWVLPIKIVLGVMFLLGIFSELAAFLGIVIFVLVFVAYGGYVFTYLNYLGELVALILFGSRFLAVDGFLLKKKFWLPGVEKLRKWEVPIIRIGLGLALLYAAVNVKFLHQEMSIMVVKDFHLERYFFNWTPQYIAVGAGMVELMIGAFILFGFAQRLTVLIFMAFITLSLLYFKEAVWPHLLLYGIAIMLFINAADFLTVDGFLIPWLRRKIGI